MKIVKSEVSFKSDVALLVVGQDANSSSNATPRDLQGDRHAVVPGCFNCRAALVQGRGLSSFCLGQLISCRLLTIVKN